uniref:Putative solute carrier n=1 Tax=Rhipicephalus microplus TaxID=6941 RepID=A0A6M2D409_RHIMP
MDMWRQLEDVRHAHLLLDRFDGGMPYLWISRGQAWKEEDHPDTARDRWKRQRVQCPIFEFRGLYGTALGHRSWRRHCLQRDLRSSFWVPESPRWLLSVGRKEEALASLERISRINGKEVSRETLNKLLLLQETNEENDVKVLSSKKPPNFLQTTLLLVKSPRIRRLTIFIYFAWFVITLCYNVITLQLGRLDLNIYSTYAIAIAFELPVNALCLVLMDTVGRRWSNTGFLLISTVACFLLGFLRPESSTWTLVLAVAAIMAMAGAYNVTNQLAPEAFPTVIRGRAVLLQKLIGDVGGLAGIQVASLVERNMYTPVLVMAALSLAATVVVFFLPETLEQALPQSIEDGENFGKDQTLCFCPISVAKRARKNRSLEKQARRTARSSNEDELGTVVTPLAGDSTV